MPYLNSKNFVILCIFFLAFVLRFYGLGKVPPSLFLDELSNGYNAYSILKTAKDEYGNKLPLTFRSFGDYNPALSVYPLVPSIYVFGLNDFAVRFPSALLGFLTVILTYLITYRIFKKWQIAAVASFLLAISPWHLQFSKYDHEANFMVFFTILGATLFFFAKDNPRSGKNYLLLLLSALSFGLALNTYHGAKIWYPLFLLNIIFWYAKPLFKLRLKLLPLLVIIILSTYPIFQNIDSSLIRANSVGIFGKKLAMEQIVSGYLSHYSPIFLFILGDTIGRHSVPGMGELYVFEFPAIVVGLVAILKKRNKDLNFLLCWLALAAIPAALATPTPHSLRSLAFIPLWSAIAAVGFYTISKLKISNVYRLLAILILTLVGSYNFIIYLHLYYRHYPLEKAIDWTYGYKQMVEYVDKVKDDYSSIAITNYAGWPHIAVLYYSKYDPAIYQPQSENKAAFGKYEFFGASWSKTKPGKALVVTPFWQAHPANVLQNIYLPNGDLRFTISTEQ